MIRYRTSRSPPAVPRGREREALLEKSAIRVVLTIFVALAFAFVALVALGNWLRRAVPVKSVWVPPGGMPVSAAHARHMFRDVQLACDPLYPSLGPDALPEALLSALSIPQLEEGHGNLKAGSGWDFDSLPTAHRALLQVLAATQCAPLAWWRVRGGAVSTSAGTFALPPPMQAGFRMATAHGESGSEPVVVALRFCGGLYDMLLVFADPSSAIVLRWSAQSLHGAHTARTDVRCVTEADGCQLEVVAASVPGAGAGAGAGTNPGSDDGAVKWPCKPGERTVVRFLASGGRAAWAAVDNFLCPELPAGPSTAPVAEHPPKVCIAVHSSSTPDSRARRAALRRLLREEPTTPDPPGVAPSSVAARFFVSDSAPDEPDASEGDVVPLYRQHVPGSDTDVVSSHMSGSVARWLSAGSGAAMGCSHALQVTDSTFVAVARVAELAGMLDPEALVMLGAVSTALRAERDAGRAGHVAPHLYAPSTLPVHPSATAGWLATRGTLHALARCPLYSTLMPAGVAEGLCADLLGISIRHNSAFGAAQACTAGTATTSTTLIAELQPCGLR